MEVEEKRQVTFEPVKLTYLFIYLFFWWKLV